MASEGQERSSGCSKYPEYRTVSLSLSTTVALHAAALSLSIKREEAQPSGTHNLGGGLRTQSSGHLTASSRCAPRMAATRTSAAAAATTAIKPPTCWRWKGHTGLVTDVQPTRSSATTSSPSRPPSLVASTSDDGTIRIWQSTHRTARHAATTRCLRYKADSAILPVSCCCWYTQHGGLILLTAHTRCIAVWDLHQCSDHIPPLVLTRPSQLLPLTVGAEEERKEESSEQCDDEVNQLIVSSDGSMLAACDDTGRWYTWTCTLPTPVLPHCPPSLSFQRLGSLHPPHDNICSSIAFIQPIASQPFILSVGFDYQVCLSSADGKQRVHVWDVNDWTNERREQLEEEGQAATNTSQSHRAPRKGHTAAERLRERMKQKHTAASTPPPSAAIQTSQQPSTASSPLTNPPFPHCLASSANSHSVLLGLGSGQLVLLSAAALASAARLSHPPLLVDAHAAAVVAVAWIGSASSGCEYWASGGSDRQLAVWRTAASREVRRGQAVTAVDRLDELAAAVAGESDVASMQCVWTVAHGWKVNSVSCESSAASVRLYVADVSERVAVYTIQ